VPGDIERSTHATGFRAIAVDDTAHHHDALVRLLREAIRSSNRDVHARRDPQPPCAETLLRLPIGIQLGDHACSFRSGAADRCGTDYPRSLPSALTFALCDRQVGLRVANSMAPFAAKPASVCAIRRCATDTDRRVVEVALIVAGDDDLFRPAATARNTGMLRRRP
jgi:hypothetical protein